MIRYRCPHCATLIVVHERRVGQSSVCKSCMKAHHIPTDTAMWLTETGEQLYPSVAAPEPVSVAAHAESHAHSASELAPTLPDLNIAEPVSVETPASREPEPVVAARMPTPRPTPVPAPRTSTPTTVGTTTPAPVRNPPLMPVSTPAPRASQTPSGEPVQLQTQADIAVALTAALTSRMKPPASPRRDLRPSTALWMLLTGIGVGMLVVAWLSDNSFAMPALVIGAVQVVFGYLWIVRLTYLRDATRGFFCAIPPIALYYLTQYKYAKLRPLRFVLTGAVLIALALTAPRFAEVARPIFNPPTSKTEQPDIKTMSRLIQIRDYRTKAAATPLKKVLEELAVTDTERSADAKDRVEIAQELAELCQHPISDVRRAAMIAYATWDTTPNTAKARAVCLEAIRSKNEDERICALQQLPRWKDAETARAVQSLIGRPSTETNQAIASLEQIGGVEAEEAGLSLLQRSENISMRLSAIGILEKVGSLKTAKELRAYAQVASDPPVQLRAQNAALAIEARLSKP